jgi:hypothetical protein
MYLVTLFLITEYSMHSLLMGCTIGICLLLEEGLWQLSLHPDVGPLFCICLLASLTSYLDIVHYAVYDCTFHTLGTNFWPYILSMSGRGDVCDNEDCKDKHKSKVIFFRKGRYWKI